MELFGEPHRRYDPLADTWVLNSPDRTARPWQGHREHATAAPRPPYDPDCYLCPGNARVGGRRNPEYSGTYVFPNDFPSLQPATSSDVRSGPSFLQARRASGTCRVLCFHPRHDLTMARMTTSQITDIVRLWVAQTDELSRTHDSVQIFENRGAEMGASNPHPHGQLWATRAVPSTVAVEDARQRWWHDELGQPLLAAYGEHEAAAGARVVASTEHWQAVVPFWATWPFETLVLPRRHVPRLPALTDAEHSSLAELLRSLLRRYDGLFDRSFPYSMGWHGAPGSASSNDRHWQLHAHFYPPLLRSATVRKFMVGFEMLGEPQRDLTPEDAAARLRSLPVEHADAAAPGQPTTREPR